MLANTASSEVPYVDSTLEGVEQFTALSKLLHDVQPTHQLAFAVQLRIRGPVAECFEPLAHLAK